MSGKLERLKWQMLGYIESDDLRKKFNEVYEQVVSENKSNVQAFIPIARFDVEKTNVGNLNWLEDYEIITGSHKDSDGEYWTDEDEYKEHMEEKADKKFEQYAVVEDEGNDGYFAIKNEDGEIVDDLIDSEDEADERVEELKQEWLDENCEDLEYEYDEILWNIVLRFNNDVDVDVAQKVGLGVLRIIDYDRDDYDNKYLFLQTCGMDMTPKYIAYQALSYGYIDEEYLSYFRDTQFSYTKYVMGSVFDEVLEELGIKDYFADKVIE